MLLDGLVLFHDFSEQTTLIFNGNFIFHFYHREINIVIFIECNLIEVDNEILLQLSNST